MEQHHTPLTESDIESITRWLEYRAATMALRDALRESIPGRFIYWLVTITAYLLARYGKEKPDGSR